MTYVVVSSGHLRGLHGLGAGSAPETVKSLLAKSQRAFDFLTDQHIRITAENAAFKAATKTPTIFALLNTLGIVEFDARINATDTLISALDNFVDVYNRVEAQALNKSNPEATRIAAAKRLLTATVNILEYVNTVSPTKDFAQNIGQTVNEVLKDTEVVLTPNEWKIPVWAYGVGIIVGLYYTSQILGVFKSSKQS